MFNYSIYYSNKELQDAIKTLYKITDIFEGV